MTRVKTTVSLFDFIKSRAKPKRVTCHPGNHQASISMAQRRTVQRSKQISTTKRKCGSVAVMLLGVVAFYWLMEGCAQIANPTGGPKDVRGPVLLKVTPAHRSVRISPRQVTFLFDEYLLMDGVSREVFVSPVPRIPPDVFVINKKLVVKFNEPLLPNRTYVITLQRGVKDFTEKNPIPETIQYAFSTGDKVEDGAVAGRITFPPTGKGPKGFTMGIYDPDSVQEKGFYKLRPIYAADADTLGRYVLSYLPVGKFVLFGFSDLDRSFSYNNPGERVAYDSLQVITITPENLQQTRDVLAFLPDTIKPVLQSVEALSPQLLSFTFSEPVQSGSITCNTDTLRWQQPTDPGYTEGPYEEGDRTRVLFFLNEPMGTDSLRFTIAATDTVGNALDTAATKRFKRTKELNKEQRIIQSKLSSPDPYTFRFHCTSPISKEILADSIVVLDSTNKPTKVNKRLAYSDFLITLPPGLDSTTKFTLVIDTTVASLEGFRLKKAEKVALKYPNLQRLGTLRGGIDSPLDSLLIILESTDKKKQRFYSYGRQFNFENVPEGEYQLILVDDSDYNHRWTPGNLVPLRQPEAVYYFPERVRIKGGLEADGLVLQYPPR